jgi:hypothetical protein
MGYQHRLKLIRFVILHISALVNPQAVLLLIALEFCFLILEVLNSKRP